MHHRPRVSDISTLTFIHAGGGTLQKANFNDAHTQKDTHTLLVLAL